MKAIPKIMNQPLTAQEARVNLEEEKIQVIRFVNTENSSSVVHSHPYYEMILNLSGSKVRYSSNGELYDLRIGELIFFPSEMYHSAVFNVTMDFSERLVLQIDSSIWHEAIERCHLKQVAWDRQVVLLNELAVMKWNLMNLIERMILSRHLNEKSRKAVLVCHLIELISMIDQSVEEKSVGKAVESHPLAAKAAAYLQTNYTESDLTAAKLAEICFTSREHLSRIFRKYMMESIHDYLTNLRMQHFRTALLEGESVIEAVASSGFSDYSSFLKTFRKLYGMTPSEYKNRERETFEI